MSGSEAQAVRRQIEELRARLYLRPDASYEQDPQLHDELDRLIVRYIQLSRRNRAAVS